MTHRGRTLLTLFATYGHTVWGENAHLIDHAVTLGVSRGF